MLRSVPIAIAIAVTYETPREIVHSMGPFVHNWDGRSCAKVADDLSGSASVLLTIAFFAGLYLFFRFTRLGVQFRGTAENALLASQRGVNVNFVLSLSWVIAIMAASLSGVLYGGRAFLSTESVTIGLAGLTAALVGGLDSLRGAVAGAFIVALAQYLTVRLISPVLSEAVPFLLLLVVMSIRPWGLFGTIEEFDRV